MGVVLIALLFALAAAVIILFALGHSYDMKASVNPIPSSPASATERLELLQLYQKEWQVVIDTQMHFNDLIIKFRTLTLTSFAALVGAALTVSKIATLTPVEIALLLVIPGVFWI